jgi:hypothetical protein
VHPQNRRTAFKEFQNCGILFIEDLARRVGGPKWVEAGGAKSEPAVRRRDDLRGPASLTWGRPVARSRGGSVPPGTDAVGIRAAGVARGRPARTRRASVPVIGRNFDRIRSGQGASHRVGTGHSAIQSLGTSSPLSPGSIRRCGDGARVIGPERRGPALPPGPILRAKTPGEVEKVATECH